MSEISVFKGLGELFQQRSGKPKDTISLKNPPPPKKKTKKQKKKAPLCSHYNNAVKLVPFAMDGQDGNGLQLENFGPVFSSSAVVVLKISLKTYNVSNSSRKFTRSFLSVL